MGHKSTRRSKVSNSSITVSHALAYLINDSNNFDNKDIKNLKNSFRNNITHNITGRKIIGIAKIRNG